MAERLRLIRNRIIDFWNKYTPKQKAAIISVVAGIVLTVAILAFVLTRTSYKELITCESASQANSVVELLDTNNIPYQLSNNSMTISVDDKQYDAAVLLLGANNIAGGEVSVTDLFDNSISTTESERKLKANIYMQDKLATTIESFDGVSKAVVYISSDSDDTASIFEDAKKNTSASIVLTTTDDFNAASASTIASMVATALGNEDSTKVRVSDSNGSLLYSGTDDLYSASASGSLLTKEQFKTELKNNRENDIRYILLKQGWDDAEVVANLKFDMDEVSELYTEYTPTTGNDQGVYKSSYEYVAENASGVGGVPGTDSNDNDDDTTYNIDDNSSANSNVKTSTIEYLPNERRTNTVKEMGAVDTEESSVSIVLSKYVVYNEDELKENGELDDTTFEQYIKDNNLEEVKQLTVDDSLIASVAAASGIKADKINITAYEQPVFNFKDKSGKNFTDYLPIILLVIIIAMILFVVFRSTAPVSVEEFNPELSVEELLATTTEDRQLDDIEYNEKSDVRKMIEKFVDENPEAVAQLLRNWLNDDWG